jgi:hypothetical protein
MAEILSVYYGVPSAHGAALGFLWLSVTIATGLIGGLVYLLGPPLGEHSELSSDPDSDEEETDAAKFVGSK